MAYEKINWKNHIVEFPFRRKIEDNEDGTYEVKPDVGQVLQVGTKQSAENFNHMEDGIADLDSRVSSLEGSTSVSDHEKRIAALETKVGETNVTQLKSDFDQLNEKVGEVDISELETRVGTIETDLDGFLEVLKETVM